MGIVGHGVMPVDDTETAEYAIPKIEAAQISSDVASWPVAIAELLAKRADAEMKTWFVENIFGKICSDDVKGYFPEFCLRYQFFSEGAAGSYSALSKPLQDDLMALPACLIWQNSPTNDRKEWGYPVTNLFQKVRKDTYPLYLVAGLADTRYVRAACTTGVEASCALYLSGVATNALLTTKQNDKNNIDASELISRAYIKMGEDKKYDLISTITPSYAGDMAVAYEYYRRRIEALNEIVKDIESKIIALRKAKEEGADGKEEALQAAFEIGQRVVDAIGAAVAIVRNDDGLIRFGDNASSDKNIKIISNEADEVARLRAVTSIVASATAGHYSDAMADLAKVTYCISEKEIQVQFSRLCGPWKDVRDHVADRKAIQNIARYVPVTMDIANAKTTEDLTGALDRAASPVGAWRLKREGFMTSIGGLVGLSYGKERLDSAETGITRGRYSALFAPVGIDISVPCRLLSSTAGIFISVVDVGNLMSFNWSDNQAIQVKEDSNTSFRQIYSPGAYLRFGLGKTPFVAGLGIAKTPGLRDAVLADGSTVKLNSTRVSAFIAVDIPLFPLF